MNAEHVPKLASCGPSRVGYDDKRSLRSLAALLTRSPLAGGSTGIESGHRQAETSRPASRSRSAQGGFGSRLRIPLLSPDDANHAASGPDGIGPAFILAPPLGVLANLRFLRG